MRILLVMAATILSMVALIPAEAAHLDQRGGSVIGPKIGPWYVVRQTYEDGSNVCWASNLHRGRSDPTFAYMVAQGGKAPTSIMRFDANVKAKPNEVVTLVIGDQQVLLVHRRGDVGNSFHPATYGDARRITRLLEARQKDSPRSFFVFDERGKKFRFDARDTTRMIGFLEEHCGYIRN